MSTTVQLPPDLAAKIQERIAAGEGADAADVVRAGLESLEAEDARRMAAVKEKIAAALADVRPSAPADEVFDRLEALLSKLPGK
jgi:antitoxin ParD1/3/4